MEELNQHSKLSKFTLEQLLNFMYANIKDMNGSFSLAIGKGCTSAEAWSAYLTFTRKTGTQITLNKQNTDLRALVETCIQEILTLK